MSGDAVKMNPTITLLPPELLLVETLIDCRNHLVQSPEHDVSCLDMWIVGGWVRDRLLGRLCSDIDVALSSMTGKAFKDVLTAFLKANHARYQNRAQELGITYSKPPNFKDIPPSDSKSQGLETAVGRLFGLDVDLVNLRRETYDDPKSRTPTMRLGTATDDAKRRDATVNALYYNLDTKQVDDFTGRGLTDLLVNRVIRTPLQPRQTFLDDPLRVLRLIRISSKLGYPIEEDTFQWMKTEGIQAEMHSKVSRERYGIEIEKMLKGAQPERGLDLILRADLYTTVFMDRTSDLSAMLKSKLPLGGQEDGVWLAPWSRAIDLLANHIHLDTGCLGNFLRADTSAVDMWYMAIYSPLAALRHGDMLRRAVKEATTALKLTRKDSELLETSLKNMDSISDTCRLVQSDPAPSRSLIGMRIRGWGLKWRAQVLYALLAEEVYSNESSGAVDSHPLARYVHFVTVIQDLSLGNADLVKPMLNGHEIMALFSVKKAGNFIKKAIEELLVHQFDHQECGTEEAKTWLLSQREALGIPKPT